jgi:hypothetical protein
MDALARGDFEGLLAHQGWPCVSIYLPTYRTGEQAQQNPIRLKNLLRQAREEVVICGMRRPEARKLFRGVEALLTDEPFWRDQSDGLAIFISPAATRHFRLPASFPEVALVSNRYFIKPLLPLASHDGRFLVLAASANRVQLFQATRWQIAEVPLATLPQGLAEALHYDRRQQVRQFHTVMAGSHAPTASAWHGQGGAADSSKDELLLYFRHIDRALHGYLHDERSPLVFAGVDYLFPIYREANTYPHLAGSHISGNPDQVSQRELLEKGLSCVQPLFDQRQRDAASHYARLAGTGQASHDVRVIVPAACQGRIESLFIAPERDMWGAVDATGQVLTHAERRPKSVDLADLAAAQTLLHGGTVYAVTSEAVPGGETLAATFRF